MVNVSASVNLPLHYEVQKFSSGTGSPGWSQKKGRKTVVVVVAVVCKQLLLVIRIACSLQILRQSVVVYLNSIA